MTSYTDSKFNTLNRGGTHKKMEPPSITQEVLASAKISKKDNILINANAEDGSVHTFSEEEKVAYSKFITERLLDQQDVLSNYIPIDPSTEQLFENCTDGVLLNKLMENLFLTQISLKGLCIKNKMNPFEMIQNQNIVIKNAIEVGCIIVNIGAQDLMNATPYLVLGIIWQIIKAGLLSKVNQNANEILEILFEEDSVKEVDNTKEKEDEHSAEEILMRWVNYHLEKENTERRISNFSEDIQDSVVYSHLFHQLVPIEFQALVETIGQESNLFSRAEIITNACEKIGVKCFLTPSDIALGHPKLNLALVASLFNSEAAIANLRREREEKHKTELERAERDRQVRERAERERLELERLEKQRQEMERIESERQERERAERERLEMERAEVERVEHERAERERLELEQLEYERQEAERAERERLEMEERERQELEEQEREERERLEFERQEREREEMEERERIERERIEREEFEMEEQERIERERIEREEEERLEAERIEQERLEAERLEQERLEREKRERDRLSKQQEADRAENNKDYRIAIRIQKRMVDDTSLTDNMSKLVGDITELKRNLIGELRNTGVHHVELKKITKSIDRVLENKKEGKKLKKQKKVIIKPVKGVPNGLDPNKMKNYQSLFYYLQNHPEVMGKLLFLLEKKEICKTFDNLLLSMFPYEISPREEDLFLRALTVSIEYQIKYSENLTDFLQSQSVPMILLNQYFKKKGFKYLKEIITPQIIKVLDATDLNLNFDPFWIQKELLIEKELKDGKKSEKKSDQTFDQLMQNNDIVSIFNSRCLQLVEISNGLLSSIVKSIEQLPVQLRYLCRIIAEKSKYGFKNNGNGNSNLSSGQKDSNDSNDSGSAGSSQDNGNVEGREKYIAYFLIIYRFINPILSSPDLLNELVLLQHPYITKQARFNLSQVSRLIQSLFSEKPWMNSFPTVYINKWIIQNSPTAEKFLQQVSNVPDLDELIHYNEYNAIMKENNIKFCSVINISEIIWLHETVLSYFYDLEDIGSIKELNEKTIQDLAERATVKLDKGKYQIRQSPLQHATTGSPLSNNNYCIEFPLKRLLDEIDFPIQLPEQGDRSIQLSFINRADQSESTNMDEWKECKLWMIDILSKSSPPKKDHQTIAIIKDSISFFKTGNNSVENMTIISQADKLIERLKQFDRSRCTDNLEQKDSYNLFLLDVEKELVSILRKNKLMRSELTRLHSLLKSVRLETQPLEHLIKFQKDQLNKAIAKKQLKVAPVPKDKSAAAIKPHKFILSDLVKKGMILRCDLPESSYNKTKIYIKSVGPGLFEIEAKFGPITKNLQLELDDLLEKSKNHIDEYPLEGITLDITLTIHLLMKLFSL